MRFEEGAEVVRARAWGLCEVDGHTAGLQTHHRQPRGMGGVSRDGMAVNRPSALLRVCLLCHNTIEHEREWAYAMGYLVQRPTVPGTVPVWLHTVNGRGWWLLTDDGCYQWQDLPEPALP